MAVTPETLHLQQELQAQINHTVDQQTRDLTDAWIRAWDEVAPDLQATLTDAITQDAIGGVVAKTLMVRSQRLQQALGHIGQALTNLATQAGVRIIGDLRGSVDRAAAAQNRIVASQLPHSRFLADLGAPGAANVRALEAIVFRSAQQITSQTWPLAPDAYDVVRRELVRGIAVGANPNHTAARILARAESGFNGGLARAINISRTETLDAHRQAAAVGQAEHTEVLAGWVWLTKLDTKTCPACVGMAGSLHSLEEPGPLGHQQCRCARMPQTKSWRELGFDVDEPPSALPDPDAWFEGLSSEEKRELLGPKRYQAWAAGEYPRSAWAQQKSNPGWRDSVVPSKPGSTDNSDVTTPTPAGGSGNGPIAPTYDTSSADAVPSLAEFFTTTENPPSEHVTFVENAWRAVMDRPFGHGGLRARLTETQFWRDQVALGGQILDADGNRVGGWDRMLYREPGGSMWAMHELLKIDDTAHQGTGFSDAFNGRLFDWYRDSGFERVEVDAAWTGRYVWASKGFGFLFEQSARRALTQLEFQEIRDGEDAASVADVLERGRLAFDHPDFPTARQISQAGRVVPSMKGRDATWPGKRALLDEGMTLWGGVLWLT